MTGRSFYTTEEFHRNFRFVATSRYGVGFLSVFAVSDSVTVETYKPTSPQGEGPLRLTLTGPRNYLLTERGERRSNGTRIEVLLRERFSKSELTDMVARWCRRVEFPILIDDLGVQSTIRAERPEQFVCEVPDVTTEGAKFVIRYFPINLSGIEGELYMLGHIDADGESWATGKLRRNYADLHPKAVLPPLPGDLACFHGISISEEESSEEGHSERLDLRTEGHQLRMSHVLEYQFGQLGSEVKEAVDSRWQELILEHLSTSGRSTTKDGWKYKQELAKEFDLSSFWFSVPETMLVHMHDSERPLSLMDLQSFSEIAVGIHWQETSNIRSGAILTEPDAEVPTWDSDVPLIDNADLESAPDDFCVHIFTERAPTRVCWHAPGYLVVYWSARGEILGTTTFDDAGFVVTLPDEQTVARQLHRIGQRYQMCTMFNAANSYVQWLMKVKRACRLGAYDLKEEQFEHLFGHFMDQADQDMSEPGKLHRLTTYLDGWSEFGDQSEELRVPKTELTKRSFMLVDPEWERVKAEQAACKLLISVHNPRQLDWQSIRLLTGGFLVRVPTGSWRGVRQMRLALFLFDMRLGRQVLKAVG